MKRIFAVMLSVILLGNGTILANTTSKDVITTSLGGHWATNYMVELYDLGVFETLADACNPNEQITRSELMRYINIMFNLIDTSDVSFVDIDASMDCYEDVKKAVAHGYIVGDSTNSMRPNDPITRQETVVVLSRLHKVEAATNVNFTFGDASAIDGWAAPYVLDAVNKGYIVGNSNNEFNPKGFITRGEIAKILYFFGGNIIQSNEVTQEDLSDELSNLTVRDTSDVISLNDLSVDGDLFITAGTKDATVKLTNVTVQGDIIVAGNNANVEFEEVVCDSLIASHKYQVFSVNETSTVKDVLVYSDVKIVGEGIKNIATKKDDVEIELEGDFGELYLLNTAIVNMSETDLDKIYVIDGAENSEITMESSRVKTANIQTGSSISGGYIYEVTISSTGVNLDCEFNNFKMLMATKSENNSEGE